MLLSISNAGSRERYSTGKTAHTVFTWWARRPMSSMREMLEAAIADLPASEDVRVLDVFAGGGTIPLVAASLGTKTYALDNNALAVFIDVSLLRFSQSHPDLNNLVAERGARLLTRLAEQTADFFPRRKRAENKTIAYFWSRSAKCPRCAARLSLQKRPWLSRKNGQSIFIARRADAVTSSYSVEIHQLGSPKTNSSAWNKQELLCPFCGYVVKRSEVESTLCTTGFDELTAFCEREHVGKTFHIANDKELLPDSRVLEDAIHEDLAYLGEAMPDAALMRWSGVVNPALYGIKRFADLFSQRQLAVLIRLCRLLREEYAYSSAAFGAAPAAGIVAFLSGLIDHLVDWNCRLCMWIPQNQQVGRALSGPGIPMMWDFVEIDPLSKAPANLWDKLDRIVAGLSSIPPFKHLPVVAQGDATRIPYADESFDVIATDPPYFDNLFYNVLADCIYVWKRLALKPIFPELFVEVCTNSSRELTASSHRHGSARHAWDYYKTNLGIALSEMCRVLVDSGIVTFVFAHSSLEGWHSVISAFQSSGLTITSGHEMHVERKRPRSIRSRSVDTSFILVARKDVQPLPSIPWPDFVDESMAFLDRETERLRARGTTQENLGHTLFGLLVVNFARRTALSENNVCMSIECALHKIGVLIAQRCDTFSLARR